MMPKVITGAVFLWGIVTCRVSREEHNQVYFTGRRPGCRIYLSMCAEAETDSSAICGFNE